MKGSSSTIRMRVSMLKTSCRQRQEDDDVVLVVGRLARRELPPVQRHDALGERPLDAGCGGLEERRRGARAVHRKVEAHPGPVAPDPLAPCLAAASRSAALAEPAAITCATCEKRAASTMT